VIQIVNCTSQRKSLEHQLATVARQALGLLRIAQHLQELWGQTVLIDYKAGAGTIIGVDFVAKSAPDGMTFGMVNSALVQLEA